jgi:hypothetical protein
LSVAFSFGVEDSLRTMVRKGRRIAGFYMHVSLGESVEATMPFILINF